MDAAAGVLSLIRVPRLMGATLGDPDVIIGMVDGPVDASHEALRGARLRAVDTGPEAGCAVPESLACQHGTFVAGILAADRDSPAPGLCPGCTVLVKAVFCEAVDPDRCPRVTPAHLAEALRELADNGARIINLSIGLLSTALEHHPELSEAFDEAFQRGVLVVTAAGNSGRVGPVPLFGHPSVIPVGSCDSQGRVVPGSNLGPSVGRRGLLAPGVGVTSVAATGGYGEMSGTSVAAPFVAGTGALLWSLRPRALAHQIRSALLLPGTARASITPPVLDAEASWRALEAEA